MKILFIFSLLAFTSLSMAQSTSIESPAIKEAIVSCLSTAPKNTDNKPNRDLVKKCLEEKGTQSQKKNDSDNKNLSPLLKEKKNEALKQCHSSSFSDNPLLIEKCLKEKGV